MARRILVTGAAGVVGEQTLKELVRRDDDQEVVAFDLPEGKVRRRLRQFAGKVSIMLGDLRNPEDVAQAVKGVDQVIHLAAVIPPRADHEQDRAHAVNVGGTDNLLRAMEAADRPARLLHMSSIATYGDRLAQPWIEVGDPLKPSPHDHYAETKIAGEELVRGSSVPWTIFRLTGVMSHRVEMDPIMFHMPLDTPFEFITARDTGYAMVQALDAEGIDERTFNLSGGANCRSPFREYLDRHMEIMGLGSGFLPDEAFAEGNFHCGYYRDSDELQQILQFQRDGTDEWFQQVKDHTNPLLPVLARATRPVARWFLLRQSEPLAARRSGDRELLERFCISQ